MNGATDPRRPRPFRAGFAWLAAAVALVRVQAPRLLLLGLLFQLLGGASQVGILALAFVLAVPALTAGMLQGLHQTASGQRPSAIVLFAAFGSGRTLPLFLLGALTIAATGVLLVVLLAGSLGSLDPALIAKIESGDPAAVQELDPSLIRNALLGTVSGLLLGAVVSFFSVPLIWFQGRSLGDALVTGVATLFRQWRALTALGLALAAIGLPVFMLIGTIMATQLTASEPSLLLTVILLVVVVVYQVLAFAAQYVAFRDLFMAGPMPPETGSAPTREDDDDQLVA